MHFIPHKTRSLIGLEITNQVKLVGILCCLLSNSRVTMASLDLPFCVGPGDQIQVLMLALCVPYQLSFHLS